MSNKGVLNMRIKEMKWNILGGTNFTFMLLSLQGGCSVLRTIFTSTGVKTGPTCSHLTSVNTGTPWLCAGEAQCLFLLVTCNHLQGCRVILLLLLLEDESVRKQELPSVHSSQPCKKNYGANHLLSMRCWSLIGDTRVQSQIAENYLKRFLFYPRWP